MTTRIDGELARPRLRVRAAWVVLAIATLIKAAGAAWVGLAVLAGRGDDVGGGRDAARVAVTHAPAIEARSSGVGVLAGLGFVFGLIVAAVQRRVLGLAAAVDPPGVDPAQRGRRGGGLRGMGSRRSGLESNPTFRAPAWRSRNSSPARSARAWRCSPFSGR